MGDDDKPIRVIIAQEPSHPLSKTEKVLLALLHAALIWIVLPPRKRRG